MQNTQLKVSIVVQDTWAVWRIDDSRGLRAPKFDNALLQDWYGCNSQKWNELLQNTNLKPEIMFVGENPSKNNKKILEGENLIIQCFHSSSSQDLLIKQLMENSYFRGSYMTDAFDSAFEEKEKKIVLSDIKKKYPAEWQEIFDKSRERFEKLLMCPGRKIIIAFGNEAFKYIQKFTEEKFQQSDIKILENKIESITLKQSDREWLVFKIYHPSPLNAKNRHKLPDQIKYLAKEIPVLQ